jgi:hypothetical protein
MNILKSRLNMCFQIRYLIFNTSILKLFEIKSRHDPNGLCCAILRYMSVFIHHLLNFTSCNGYLLDGTILTYCLLHFILFFSCIFQAKTVLLQSMWERYFSKLFFFPSFKCKAIDDRTCELYSISIVDSLWVMDVYLWSIFVNLKYNGKSECLFFVMVDLKIMHYVICVCVCVCVLCV